MADDVVGEITGVAAKGGVVLLGNLVLGRFTEESVEVGAAFLYEDVVCKFTGVVTEETEGFVVDKALKGATDEEDAVKAGVILSAKVVLGKFTEMVSTGELEIEGVVVQLVSKGQSLCLLGGGPGKFPGLEIG